MTSLLPELRCQPTIKRIRVRLGAEPVADTERAVLVWEPRRVVPSYAVPRSDVIDAHPGAGESVIEVASVAGTVNPAATLQSPRRGHAPSEAA